MIVAAFSVSLIEAAIIGVPVERAVEVDGHHPAPLLVGELDERVERGRHGTARRQVGDLLLDARVDPLGAAGDARVVHPDVHRAELRLHLPQGTVDGGTVADVGLHGQAVAGQARSQLRRLKVDVEHGHACPVAGQPQAGRLADPRAAAGDQRDPAVEPLHGLSYDGSCSRARFIACCKGN
jgi:hypothetical protein